MSAREHSEKRDVGSWIRFLESQVANRNSEIALLRGEILEKAKVVEQLQDAHEQDTLRLAEMTDALVIASSAIKELELQIAELREAESRLCRDVDLARAEVESLQLKLVEKKPIPILKRRSTQMGAALFIFGVAIGLVPRFSAPRSETVPDIPASTRTEIDSLEVSEIVAEATKAPLHGTSGVALSAKSLESKILASKPPEQKAAVVKQMEESVYSDVSAEDESKVVRKESEPPLSREDWMNIIGQVRSTAFSVDKKEDWSVSRDYKDMGYPIVITRAQFRDVVSKTLPTALPSRNSDGLFLYDFDSSDVDRTEFLKRLRADGVPSASLCRPWDLDPAGYRRLSIVVSGRSTASECLKRLTTSQWFKHSWEEISVINLVAEPRFSASYFADKKFFSFQEWKPEWISTVTVGAVDEAAAPAVVRARRLASIARVLVKSSDVHIEVPASDSGYVSFGNFAVVPNGIVKGSLRATRISVSTGRTVGKTVSQPVAANAKAVIINGAEVKPEKQAQY